MSMMGSSGGVHTSDIGFWSRLANHLSTSAPDQPARGISTAGPAASGPGTQGSSAFPFEAAALAALSRETFLPPGSPRQGSGPSPDVKLMVTNEDVPLAVELR
jgi:hypothetical protein